MFGVLEHCASLPGIAALEYQLLPVIYCNGSRKSGPSYGNGAYFRILSRDSDRGSIPGKGKTFLSSPQRSDRLWSRPSLICNEYRRLFPGR
jgi:hypothetical protein